MKDVISIYKTKNALSDNLFGKIKVNINGYNQMYKYGIVHRFKPFKKIVKKTNI